MTGVLMVIKKLKIWTKDTLLFNDAILELFEGGKRQNKIWRGIFEL